MEEEKLLIGLCYRLRRRILEPTKDENRKLRKIHVKPHDFFRFAVGMILRWPSYTGTIVGRRNVIHTFHFRTFFANQFMIFFLLYFVCQFKTSLISVFPFVVELYSYIDFPFRILRG